MWEKNIFDKDKKKDLRNLKLQWTYEVLNSTSLPPSPADEKNKGESSAKVLANYQTG